MTISDDPGLRLRGRQPLPTSREELLFRSVLVAAERTQNVVGAVTLKAIIDETKLSPDIVEQIVASPKFRSVAESRGIEMVSAGLSPLMEDAVRKYFNSESGKGWTHHRKLAAAGVTPMQWANWMRIPVFAAYVDESRRAIMQGAAVAAELGMAAKAEEGDMKAVEFLLKKEGVYDAAASNIDLRAVLDGIFEVLESSDLPETVLTQIAAGVQRVLTVQSAVSAVGPRQIGA